MPILLLVLGHRHHWNVSNRYHNANELFYDFKIHEVSLNHHYHHHHHLFLKRPFFHAKLGLDVCPKSSPSTYP